MIEAVNFWNEPNNKSHWDFEVDPRFMDFLLTGTSGTSMSGLTKYPKSKQLPSYQSG